MKTTLLSKSSILELRVKQTTANPAPSGGFVMIKPDSRGALIYYHVFMDNENSDRAAP
jgi:hypothetical protein